MNTSSNKPTIKAKEKSQAMPKARHPMFIFLIALFTARAGFHLEQSQNFKGKNRA
jgi:hypothetical protein